MNTKLQEAVEIFKTLGGEHAGPADIMKLSTGTAEQKRTALAGLKSGEWGKVGEIAQNRYGWQSYIDVDEGNFALFAIRIGVDARRAASISRSAGKEMLVEAVADRGSEYAADFIGYACVSRRRIFEHSASMFGHVAVRLVDRLDLDVPQNVEYMKDWSVYAAAAMGLKSETRYGETDLPDAGIIGRRFHEHISTGIAVNVPATGPFGAVLPAGVKCGWLDREKALGLVFSALDAAVRPGDRKVWLNVLDQLKVTEQEIHARTEALIPLLAMGDPAVIIRLSPVLIAQSEHDLLAEVLTASFSAATKKAKQTVLRAALGSPCPQEVKELAPWLAILAADQDKTVAALAGRLAGQWGITAKALPAEADEVPKLWQDTPPVWQIPFFDTGDISPEALTALTAQMVSRPALIHDVETERFLAVANALAYRDPEAARISMQGLKPGFSLLYHVVCWIRKEEPRYGFDKSEGKTEPPLTARDYMVCRRLGLVPCLLSTPSMSDLSIGAAELADRLEQYQNTGIDVLEADLFLALTRLDVRTKTPAVVKMLREIRVPVVLQSGEYLPVTAGETVLAYLDQPFAELPLTLSQHKFWSCTDITVPESMQGFPLRFSAYYWYYELYSVFPLWGDFALREVRWDSEVYHEQGLILRQAARRAVPLPAGAAINLLAAQRSMTPDAAGDSMLAVTEAWERGLLRPGIADPALLDWSAAPPAKLAALAAALDGIARDGLLSVVWPILDVVIEVSLKAPRLLAGTAEFAALIKAFLPSVRLAAEQGRTDQASLLLPGIRALARHGGSSRAVGIAQEVAAELPPEPAVLSPKKNQPADLEPSFAEVWPEEQPVSRLFDDGAMIRVDWFDPSSPTRLFLFTLTLPGETGQCFQIVNRGWYYDMEREGQCRAYAVAHDAGGFAGNEKNEVWLHWDVQQSAMAVCRHRNWVEEKDGPLRGTQAPPLPLSLLTVMIGLLAQDGDAIYFAPRLVRESVERGAIDWQMVRRAAVMLLQSPVVSPAKLVRALEKDIRLLPVFWPLLTESVKAAGAAAASGEAVPVWVNRILDIALRYAPYLAEAAVRGLIPPEDAQWPGMSEIASAKSKSTAVAKAKTFLHV